MANLIFKWTNNQQHDHYKIYTSDQPFDRNNLPENHVEVPSTENSIVLEVENDLLYAMMEVVTSEGSVFGELINVDPQDPIISWRTAGNEIHYNQADVNTLKWKDDTGSSVAGVDVSDLGVIVSRGRAGADNVIVAYDNDGNREWTWNSTDGTNSTNSNRSKPVCYKDRVYFCTGNHLASLNVNTGGDFTQHEQFPSGSSHQSLSINSTGKLCWVYLTEEGGQQIAKIKLFDLENAFDQLAESQLPSGLTEDMYDATIANDSNTVYFVRNVNQLSPSFMDQPKLVSVKLDTGAVDSNLLNARYSITTGIKNRGSVLYLGGYNTGTRPAGLVGRELTETVLITLNTQNGVLTINNDVSDSGDLMFIFDIMPRRDGKVLLSIEASQQDYPLVLLDMSENTSIMLGRPSGGNDGRYTNFTPYIGSHRYRLL